MILTAVFVNMTYLLSRYFSLRHSYSWIVCIWFRILHVQRSLQVYDNVFFTQAIQVLKLLSLLLAPFSSNRSKQIKIFGAKVNQHPLKNQSSKECLLGLFLQDPTEKLLFFSPPRIVNDWDIYIQSSNQSMDPNNSRG